MSYGWMGRSPDYKASFLGTLGANSEFYAPFEDNAKRWYKESQEKVLYWNHAIINPPVDRNLPPDEVGDVFMKVERETDAGLIVSGGAKVVATGSAITNYNFIAHYGLPIKKKEFALICTVPMDAPGIKLICRTSYSQQAAVMGSPFDYPLSSRFDENDTVFIFDKVLVPWENVFLYGDIEKINGFFPVSGSSPASPSTAASGSPPRSTSSPGCCSRPSRSRAARTSAVCRPASVRSSAGATPSTRSPTRWPATPTNGPTGGRCCPSSTTA